MRGSTWLLLGYAMRAAWKRASASEEEAAVVGVASCSAAKTLAAFNVVPQHLVQLEQLLLRLLVAARLRSKKRQVW